MKVQLSPWRIMESSLAFSFDDKRRTSNSKLYPPEFSASVVVDHSSDMLHQSKRKSKRKAKQRPLVSITSSHRITILTEAKDPNQVQQGDDLQFSSRPGKGFSFLSSEKAPPVAAVFDDETDRTFALQKNNTKLVSFLASSNPTGGNESEFPLSVTLNEPALDMQLLHLTSDKSSIVYGTCLDGKVFVARCCENPNGQSDLLVEYFGASSRAPLDYVGTVCQLEVHRERRPEVGGQPCVGKRKRDEDPGHSNHVAQLFQITRSNTGVSLIRHTISLKRKGLLQQRNAWAEAMHSSAPVDVELVQPENSTVESISLVGLDTSNEMGSITVMYSCLAKAGRKDLQSYITTITLTPSVATVGHIVPLPNDPLDVCYVGRSVIAMVTRDMDLVLFDCIRGPQLLRQPLSHLLGTNLRHCQLLADANSGRLIVLFSHGDTVAVASSKVVDDNGISLVQSNVDLSPYHLADRVHMFRDGRDSGVRKSELASLAVLPNKNAKQCLATARGLDTLQDAFREIASGSSLAGAPSFLRRAFQSAVQGGLAKEVSKNGKHKNGSKKHMPNGKNGLHKADADSASFISSISFEFAGSAACVMVRLLSSKSRSRIGTVRQDACFALEQLVVSGHVSARDHLTSSSYSFLRLLQGIGCSSPGGCLHFSPLQFIKDMLHHCADVSERQMVASLRYVLVYADPKEIPEFFADSDTDVGLFSDDRGKKSNGKAVAPTKDAATRLSGTAWLLSRFISYSSCNESLLRHALANELAEAEGYVLLRLLSLLLRRRGGAQALVKISYRSLQWASCLVDVVGTHDGARRMLNHILRSVATERYLTESVLRVQKHIRGAESMLPRTTSDGTHANVTAPYQIEHLMF